MPPTPESNTPTGASLAIARSADRAGRITPHPELAEAAAQGVDQQQAPHHRLAEAGQQLERLQRLQAANDADQRTGHAGLAASQLRLAAMTVQAVVAGAVVAPGIEHRELALQANRRAGHQRLAGGHAGGVDRLAGGEVVAAVE